MSKQRNNLPIYLCSRDHLCGLVVGILIYRSRSPGSFPRRYQIFWEVAGLERIQLSLVSTIEELLGRKRSNCGLEKREYGRRDLSRWPRGILYSQKLALTSSTSSGRSVEFARGLRLWSLVFFLVLCSQYVSQSSSVTKGWTGEDFCSQPGMWLFSYQRHSHHLMVPPSVLSTRVKVKKK
jgi:hypothetical protein